MKLSIWPKANPHPKTKEEKGFVGFQVSSPNLPTTVEFEDSSSLITYVTQNAWSPFVFSGVRNANNFVSCDFLVYDIDDGLTIDKTEDIIKKLGLCCLCLPSPSHSEQLHKFRIILPLAYSITSPDVYIATWLKGADIFGTVDEQCKDLARFFNSSTTEDGFWEEGVLFEPQAPKQATGTSPSSDGDQGILLPVSGDINETVKAIYGEERHFISESVDFFIRNAHTGLQGEWINSLNRFCFSLALSEISEDVILRVCNELAPSELDKKDLYQIKKAISDARKV